MLSYLDFSKRFGAYLSDPEFQSFLESTFTDLTTYNVSQSEYMISESTEIELGYTNEDAIFDEDDEIVFKEGNPRFSHFNIYPKSVIIINELPFRLKFTDDRNDILKKIGQPTKTNRGDFLGTPFLTDHYKVDKTVISIDYFLNYSIKHFQIRDNDLLLHLKL
ncbi:hypothetical protein [Mucilaginibacter sp.]|uniref:hypothetical protein n=1 Tax=Mucilaginibacter sp. TaxID=1882438 RepID=UPI0025E767BF|nr:hypothetical protein [Mucilaginibacter sp.]